MRSMRLHHGLGSSTKILKITLKFREQTHFVFPYLALDHANHLSLTYSFSNALSFSRHCQ
jgi:hypothetical protein